MRVAILDDYLDTLRSLDCFATLADHDVTVFTNHVDDVDELARRLRGFEALVLIRERTRVPRSLIEQLPELRLISQRSAYPHIDIDACTEHGVLVCSNLHAGTPSYATAELTWALVLAAARRLPTQVEGMRRGEWQTAIGRTVRGKRLGVYGYGRIGRAVAEYGRAFGMQVWFWARPASRATAVEEGSEVAPSRDAFFAESDVVTLHLRLVPETRHLVGPDDLARMKPDSILVNTSRAGLLAPGALVAAVRAGRPGYAAVDVYDHEPLTDVADPLLTEPNVICTPHLGYVTVDEWQLQFADVFDQINTFAAGAPINVVNPDALTPGSHA